MIGEKRPAFLTDDLPLWSAPFGLKLLELVRFRKEAKILDIGSGFGFPAIELAMRFGETSFVYGIDPWMEGIEMAREKAEKMGICNIRFLKQSAENPDFEAEFFDLIVANNSLNNVQDPGKVLEECYRISKQGAQLVFTLGTENIIPEFYGILEKVLREMGLIAAIGLMKKHILEKRKPVEEISNMILAVGFTIGQCVEDIFYLRYLDGTAFLQHSWIRFAFLPSWQSIISENEQIAVFERLEKALNTYAAAKGELRLSVPFATFDCLKQN